MEKLTTALEKVAEQMVDPNVKIEDNPKEKDMSDEKKPAKKKVAKKKATNGHAADDGLIKLADLAKELKIEPRVARIKLRKAEIENPGRWAFKPGSALLTQVRKLLSAE